MKAISVMQNNDIELSSPELLFLAKSGQPYRGSVYVHYITGCVSIDLVSFKRFITSLREVTLTSEDIAQHIYKEINKVLNTESLNVTVYLTARGGIQQKISYGVPHAYEKMSSKVFQV